MQHSARPRLAARALGLLGFVLLTSAAVRPSSTVTVRDTLARSGERRDDSVKATNAASGFALRSSILGRSGKLRARILGSASLVLPAFSELFGDSAARAPGVYTVLDSAGGRRFSLITLRPFSDKVNGRIGRYHIGNWPFERRTPRSRMYANPDGFIEVTEENQDTHVSEHFRLRDFLTHDQPHVWPKYLVLDERLLDKLELTVAELNRRGVRVSHVSVMSGFRTPQYNRRGVGKGRRAEASRHQYGDAADVFVDNDRNGWMDDLNRDGRVNHRDARILLDAVEHVEREYPELVGGVGIYRATRAHGPFAHIDVRGHRARWGLI
jgi:uncharacterized protein YcbK (DUF882 family)